jgi:hypothetical protein
MRLNKTTKRIKRDLVAIRKGLCLQSEQEMINLSILVAIVKVILIISLALLMSSITYPKFQKCLLIWMVSLILHVILNYHLQPLATRLKLWGLYYSTMQISLKYMPRLISKRPEHFPKIPLKRLKQERR